MSITRHIQSVLRDNPGRSWNDLVHSTLLQRLSATTGTVSDLWTQWLNLRGYPYSSLSDMLQAYWNHLNVPTEERNYFTLGWLELFSTPLPLFANGEQGAWYDPSDMSTLFQDAEGTTPVTALGQPVGRMLDKSGRGNHITQATAAARPTLEARVNVLTSTQAFSTIWNNNGLAITDNTMLAPDGTMTAASTTSAVGTRFQLFNVTAGTTWTYSLHVRPADPTKGVLGYFDGPAVGVGASYSFTPSTLSVRFSDGPNLVNGGITALPDGWYRFSLTFVAPNTGGVAVHIYPLNADLHGWWGAQLEPGPTATTYQRVTTATDYADIGAPRYLQFDGVDDFLTIGTFNMSASDKVTVCAGVRKLSDAAPGTLVELSASAIANVGAFRFLAPEGAVGDYGFGTGGTIAGVLARSPATFPPPITSVLVGIGDIGGDVSRLRVNGVQVANTAADQGTGNYGAAYPLFVGRSGGTTLPFNGNLYGLVIRGTEATTPQIAALERYMAQKTGIPA